MFGMNSYFGVPNEDAIAVGLSGAGVTVRVSVPDSPNTVSAKLLMTAPAATAVHVKVPSPLSTTVAIVVSLEVSVRFAGTTGTFVPAASVSVRVWTTVWPTARVTGMIPPKELWIWVGMGG